MYLDPGFGGMLVQLIVAIAAVGGAVLFSFRKKIKTLFSKNKDSTPASRPSVNLNELSDEDTIDVLADDN